MKSVCEIVDAELARNSDAAGLSMEARIHMAQCPRCRTLSMWLSQPAALPPVEEDAMRRIAGQLAVSKEAVQPITAPGWLALRLWLGFAGVGLSLAWGFVRFSGETNGLDLISPAQAISILATIGAVAAIFVFLLAKQMIPGSRPLISAGYAVGLGGVAVAAGFLLLFPWSPVEPLTFLMGWRCSLRESTVALPAAAVLWLLARQGVVTKPSAAGCIMGALAGLTGLTAFQLRCPIQDSLHLLAWHGAPVLLAAAAGVLAGSMKERFLRSSA